MPRPPWFDKDACLASTVRALVECGGSFDATFLVDGAIPNPRRAFMAAHGDVVDLGSTDARGLYRAAIGVHDRQYWPDHDVVYVCEDDYVHTPDAFRILRGAVEKVNDAGFFSLFDHPDLYLPSAPRATTIDVAADHHWRPVHATGLTYGARVGALRSQKWVHRAAAATRPLNETRVWSALQRRKAFRLLPQARAARMVSAVPALASQVQEGRLAPAIDWASVHHDALVWAKERGFGGGR